MKYWLMKTEPETFSINDLKNSPNKTASWDGVRNYQARNFMRDEMKLEDLVYIYHSSCDQIGIAGLAEVTKESHPDLSALDKKSSHFDPKATSENPRWYMVDLKWRESFARIIPLAELKQYPELADFQLLKKGNRLSILPLTQAEFKFIRKLV